jgi:hypothetical protein
MKVSWVISQDIPDNVLDMNVVKEIAPSWGSWTTWKKYKTDNCICADVSESRNLIKRAFHVVCNFYISQDSYTTVGSPLGVKLYNGRFGPTGLVNKDDIVALNLAAPNNNIVLMSGFNLSPNTIDNHREEYYYNVKSVIESHPNTQFVLVDYTHELGKWIREVDNLTLDTIESVKSLLV